MIGLAVGILTTAISNISNGIPFWHGIGKAGVIGAVSGAISFGIGKVATTTFTNTLSQAAIKAGLTGFSSGIMTCVSGGDFGKGFISGFISSAISSAVEYGVGKIEKEAVFQKGVKKMGVKPGDAVPQTDEFIAKAQAEWFPDAPKEALINHSVENVPENMKKYFLDNPDTKGATLVSYCKADDVNYLTGKSNVYYNPNGASFTDARSLFDTMGHELIHVTQISSLAGLTRDSFISFRNSGGEHLMEHYAWNGQHEYLSPVAGGLGYQGDPDNIMEIMKTYDNYNKLFNLSNKNYDWLRNANFKDIK